jgi:hypothetical protein
MVYKKVGTKETGELISELTTIFNIGQAYNDLSNKTPVMDVTHLSEKKDAGKN